MNPMVLTWEDDILLPPFILLTNVDFFFSQKLQPRILPVPLGHDVVARPLQSLADESLFSKFAQSQILDSLISDANLARRVVIDVREGGTNTEPSLPERVSLLLALHARADGLDPARIGRISIRFLRSRISLASRGHVILDGNSVDFDEARAIIAARCAVLPRHTVIVESWKTSSQLLSHDAELDDEDLFALTLRLFLSEDDPQFWRALRLFALGIEQSGRRDREMAAALIGAGFEALFPIRGTEAISAQFQTIGSMLVPHERMKGWFKDMYEIRCGVLHGTGVSDSGGKKRMPRVVRDIELAKTVFQYCAVQLHALRFDERWTRGAGQDETEDDSAYQLAAKRHWFKTIDDRLGWDNQQLCLRLKQKHWDATAMRGFLFDAEDDTATLVDLLLAGTKLFAFFLEGLDPVAVLGAMKRERVPRLVKFLRNAAKDAANEGSRGKRKKSEKEPADFNELTRQVEGDELSEREYQAGLAWLAGDGASGIAGAIGKNDRAALDLANELSYFLLALEVTIQSRIQEGTGIHSIEGHELIDSWRDAISAWNIRISDAPT